ncbi:hypothetical protein RHGRI_017431 [Rhododendron griersonianum]|uniref:Cation-transporting P-type ATPase N-terminal domain-containing protein n=1 Tax=Rhododendron griersonianum TaxID=479676 RepID=A0AAV6JXS9_9ERIC|nr:hypothetical protein RHGRI_017431 [Rhododendron griersonianum]
MLRGSWNISLGMNMKRIFIWWYAKRFLHPRIVATYDYVFVRDDDLGVEHFDPEEYIKLVRKYGLEISQLGFLEPNGGFTWQMTNKRDDNEVHNTIPTVGRRKLQPFLAPPRSSIEMPWSIRYPASKGEKEKGTFPLLEVQYHAIGECHSDFGDGEQFPSVCMLWGLDRCLILRVNGELSQLDLNDGRERELTDSVELFWVTCGLSEEKTNLIEKVSWFGIRLQVLTLSNRKISCRQSANKNQISLPTRAAKFSLLEKTCGLIKRFPEYFDVERFPLEDVFEQLRTSRGGLTSEDAEVRLQIFGPNKLEEKTENKILKFLSFMWNPLSWAMEAAAVMAIVLANGGGQGPDGQDCIGIVCLLLINSTISFIEENNAGNAAASLMAHLAPKTKGLRDGRWQEQDAAVLVPGDIINIKLGDIIPADARLLEGDSQKIDMQYTFLMS